MKILFIFLALTAFSSWGSSDELGPFETDYCTNFPEGTSKAPELWKHCCLMHDMFFWAGGGREDRDKVDLKLRSCIEATGEMNIAKLMYWTVRITSYSPIKYSKKKWNHGWQGRPESQVLSELDIDQIEQEILNGHDYIPHELKQSFIWELRSR